MATHDATAEQDDLVIARARAGDQAAFRDLVDRHGRAVFRVAYRVTGRVEDAEDVVQETFLKAFRQLDRFEARANVRTWLHRIAANCAVDLLRARPTRELPEESTALDARERSDDRAQMLPAERGVLGAQISARMARALELLTATERAAFTLRHFEGCSIDEVSRALGLGASAAKHSIFRAVRKMRRELQPFIEG